METAKANNEGVTTIICDGDIEIVRLTEEYYDEATEIYMNCFVQNENICISTGIRNDNAARDEIEILFRTILRDNTSFGAKDIATNRLGAICVNKILEPKSHCDLEEVFQKFKTPQMIYVGKYLDQMENTYDLYKNLNIDCCMEVVFLSTRPEFERKGLARLLTQYSMHFARNLGSDLFPDTCFPQIVQGKRPKAVCSVFTSKFTQLIGEKLDFETVYKVPYTELTFNGYSLASKLDPIHVYSTFAVKRL